MWELLIIAIDLTAVITKATSSRPSYDALVAAEREKVKLAADRTVRAARRVGQRKQADLAARARIHRHGLETRYQAAKAVHHGRLAASRRIIRMQIAELTSPPTQAPVPAPVLPDQIATTVRKYRAEHGLSQQKLAAILGCSVSTVGRLENGKQNPSSNTLQKLYDKLGFQAASSADGSAPQKLRLVPPAPGSRAGRGNATGAG